jgi:transcriptional regulator with GAF, ATPase, and Fis domain
MNIKEKEFFRKASLIIFGSLAIEKVLLNLFLFIKKSIPINHILVSYYDKDAGIFEIIAHATEEGRSSISYKYPVTPEQRKMIDEGRRTVMTVTPSDYKNFLGAWEEVPEGMKSFGQILSMDLVLDNTFIATLMVSSEGEKTFSEKHIQMLSLLRKPFALSLTNSFRFKELQQMKLFLTDESRYFQNELQKLSSREIIGADFGLREAMDMIRQVSPQLSPVLLLGETGVGKGVIASAIHRLSHRSDGPFIKVNCGGFPETVIDSELFGHERGAFTGAVSKTIGRFERANGGTIFLDEIGELSSDAQVKLLRILQEKEFERVGGSEVIKVDIRLIIATHRDLEKMVKEGTFREDLYFRLNVFPVVIPPLRDRMSDIPTLVQHFIQKKSKEMKIIDIPRIAPGAMDRLMAYKWPGNIRELENAVERALILRERGVLTFNEIDNFRRNSHNKKSALGKGILSLNQAMTRCIQNALSISRGKVAGSGGAAEILDINPRTLRHRMRKFGIPFGRKASDKYQTQ